jgi:hypothetical protein
METREVNDYVMSKFGSNFSVKELTPISGLEHVVVSTLQRATPKRSIYTDQDFYCKDECVGVLLKRKDGAFDYSRVVGVVGEGGYGVGQSYGSKCEIRRLDYDPKKRMISITVSQVDKGSTDMYFARVEGEIEVLNDELGCLKVKKKLKGESERNVCGNYAPPKMKDVTGEIEFNGV